MDLWAPYGYFKGSVFCFNLKQILQPFVNEETFLPSHNLDIPATKTDLESQRMLESHHLSGLICFIFQKGSLSL